MRYFTLLIALSIFSPTLSAQVGVNNSTPEQALDVEGKMKVSDDATAPSAGTIRYNDIERDFEGHDGTEWQSFTTNSMLPDGIQAVQYFEFGLPNNNTWTFADQGLIQDTDFSAQLTIPAGKFFVVDKVIVTPTTNTAGSYYVGIRQSNEAGNGFNPQVFFRMSGPENAEATANRTPLLVIRAGNRFQLFNSTTSPGNVRFQVYGFYVDEVSDFYGL